MWVGCEGERVTVKLGRFTGLLRAPRESKAPTSSEHSIWERLGMECGDEDTALGPAERGGGGPGAVVKPSLTVTRIDTLRPSGPRLAI